VTPPGDAADGAPLALEYADPLRRGLDVDAVIRRAHRTRARRWALLTAVGVAVVTAIGSAAVDRVGAPARTAETAQTVMARVMAQPFAREHPPVGSAVLVDNSVPGWIVVAWVSASGEFCGGAAATTGGRLAPSALNCWLDTVGSVKPELLSKPILQALPLPPDAGDRALAIGAVTGDVSEVEVIFRGRTVDVPVVGIPTGARAKVEAYAVWLPTDGTDSYSWNDITGITARDSTGRIVARLP